MESWHCEGNMVLRSQSPQVAKTAVLPEEAAPPPRRHSSRTQDRKAVSTDGKVSAASTVGWRMPAR